MASPCGGWGSWIAYEQPGLAPDDKRLYGTLYQMNVDRQMAGLDIPFQAAPVARQVMQRLTRHALRCDLALRLVQPAFKLAEDRQAPFLASDEPLVIGDMLDFTLDALQLVYHRQRRIGTSRRALGLHPLRLDKLASCMRHARQSFNTGL